MKPKMATMNAPKCKHLENEAKMYHDDVWQVLTVLSMSKLAGTYHTRHAPNPISELCDVAHCCNMPTPTILLGIH